MINAQKSRKAHTRLGLRITNYDKNHIHLTFITGVVIISNNMDHKLQLNKWVFSSSIFREKDISKMPYEKNEVIFKLLCHD